MADACGARADALASSTLDREETAGTVADGHGPPDRPSRRAGVQVGVRGETAQPLPAGLLRLGPGRAIDLRARHKFGARATTVDGIRFASQAEAQRYAELRLLERAGV